MACERTSDERIGEFVIKKVFQEQLKEVSLEEAVPLSLSETPEVKNEEEQKMVVQLATMVRIIGDKVKDDQELIDAIDGLVASGKESNQRNYWQMVKLVFEDGQITWERIAVLFYVAGRMAVKMVEANLSPLVLDILKWTVDYFRSKLLSWVKQHGGWINSFSELARCQMERMSSMTTKSHGFLLIFLVGIAVGSLITWTVEKRT
ncbi:BCL2 associated X, apoptosis regulator b [Osmerus eperlanus]|uniref:BCL2 associated X, apoptosis regulator b n=1 Tax=Osmerus eperlanus TaxID=29151 RepID=UPI002E1148E4